MRLLLALADPVAGNFAGEVDGYFDLVAVLYEGVVWSGGVCGVQKGMNETVE